MENFNNNRIWKLEKEIADLKRTNTGSQKDSLHREALLAFEKAFETDGSVYIVVDSSGVFVQSFADKASGEVWLRAAMNTSRDVSDWRLIKASRNRIVNALEKNKIWHEQLVASRKTIAK